MNKRQAAELLRISERTLTDWQQRGCPYTPGGSGREGDYDPVAIARWAAVRNLGEPRSNSPGDPESPGVRGLSREPSADIAQDITREISGRVLGKLLSVGTIPACLGMMTDLGFTAERALSLYLHLTWFFTELNDRLLGEDAPYLLDEPLTWLSEKGDGRARLIQEIERRFATRRASSAPQ